MAELELDALSAFELMPGKAEPEPPEEPAQDACEPSEEQEATGADSLAGPEGVTRMTTDTGQPVYLVHTVQRESGTVTPKNLARRATRSVGGFVGFIISAVIISVIASLILSYITNGGLLPDGLMKLWPFK